MNYIDRQFLLDESRDRTAISPFLKWAGGKRWLFSRYRHLFPRDIETLIDPFLGGGSSFFYLRPKNAVLSDLNPDLINLYKLVRDEPRRITRRLVRYHHAHSKSFFYKTRATKPTSAIDRAAWLLYLNRTCWNGLFRVNLKGSFNVPIGTKDTVFTSIDELDRASIALKRTTVISSDFEAVIDCAKMNDLIFADPPYFDKRSEPRFVKYNSNVFSWADQIRLRDALIRARSRGAKCFVTNANHRSLISLYRDCGTIHKLKRQSVVSGSNKGRGIDIEILVEIS